MNWDERFELGSVRARELRAEAARADLLRQARAGERAWTFRLALPFRLTLQLRVSRTGQERAAPLGRNGQMRS